MCLFEAFLAQWLGPKIDMFGGLIWWLLVLVGVSFDMLSFNITNSSPFSLKLWVTSGFTYPYLFLHGSYSSFLEMLPLAEREKFMKWMQKTLCDRKESVSWKINVNIGTNMN